MFFSRSTVLIIIGATGDLAQKKIFPALISLENAGLLEKKFEIIAFSRRPWTDSDFRHYTLQSLTKNAPHLLKHSKKILKQTRYIQGDLSISEDFTKLANYLRLDLKTSNKIFFLAISPDKYESVLSSLSTIHSSISHPDSFTRVLIEKPYGRSGSDSDKLNSIVARSFAENEIFRNDHYLAKEALQALLHIKFNDPLYSNQWSNKHIDRVEIRLHERGDVSNRAEFYDSVGALLDVGQNHILSMLSMVAMHKPQSNSENHIRAEREQILSSIVTPSRETISSSFVRAQYEGYAREKGVKPNSQTETYFKTTLLLDDPQWTGVPFILEAGKAMVDSKVTITIHFKDGNELVVRVSPEPFLLHPIISKEYTDAYEKVIHDAIAGDQTVFLSKAEISAMWKYIDAIKHHIESAPLHSYPKSAPLSFFEHLH